MCIARSTRASRGRGGQGPAPEAAPPRSPPAVRARARAVARLNHPQSARLRRRRQDDLEFLVMGTGRRDACGAADARALPLDEALKHASALAQALARAHPRRHHAPRSEAEQLMLTESGVKLLDFGLAKLREREEAGPPASPLDDQSPRSVDPRARSSAPSRTCPRSSSKAPVDARTDIYALGLSFTR